MKSERKTTITLHLTEREALYLHNLTQNAPQLEGMSQKDSYKVEPESEFKIREDLYMATAAT